MKRLHSWLFKENIQDETHSTRHEETNSDASWGLMSNREQ